jgi:hypothetical protein
VKGLLIVGFVVGAVAALMARLVELAARILEGEILAHRLDQLFGSPVRHRSYQRYFGRPIRSI